MRVVSGRRASPVTDVTGDAGWIRSGEADVQIEVPEPETEDSAASPVHDERQQDDGQDYHDHPEEEHDDAGDRIPGYRSRSSHGYRLPITARLIQRAGPDELLGEGGREPLLVLLGRPVPVDDEEPVHLGGQERVDQVGRFPFL